MNKRTWSWSVPMGNWAIRVQPQWPHQTIREVCRDAGISGIEAHLELFTNETPRQLEEIARGYREADLAITSFHLPFRGAEIDIAAFYETLRARAVATMRYWMERAAALGCAVVIAHPTTNRLSVDVEGLDNYLRALERSLAELLPAAQSLRLIFALENMLPGDDGGRFGSRPEHFRRFIEAFDHPALGFCLDTGHALVSCQERAHEMFDAMAPRMKAFHLADNPGDRDLHLAPGHGRVDWNRVFRQMAGINFTGTACIETPPFNYGPAYRPESFREMIQNTDRLVAQALGT